MSCACTADVFVEGTSVHLLCGLAVDGASTDAASVTLRLRNPADVVTLPVVFHPGAGIYEADINASIPGQWWYRWETVAPDSAREGSFDVGNSHVI